MRLLLLFVAACGLADDASPDPPPSTTLPPSWRAVLEAPRELALPSPTEPTLHLDHWTPDAVTTLPDACALVFLTCPVQ